MTRKRGIAHSFPRREGGKKLEGKQLITVPDSDFIRLSCLSVLHSFRFGGNEVLYLRTCFPRYSIDLFMFSELWGEKANIGTSCHQTLLALLLISIEGQPHSVYQSNPSFHFSKSLDPGATPKRPPTLLASVRMSLNKSSVPACPSLTSDDDV